MSKRKKLIKAGRPRIENVKRTSYGRISRTKSDIAKRQRLEQKENMATVIEYRIRKYGLSEEEARDRRTGFLLGRLHQAGLISNSQYEAGEKFASNESKYWKYCIGKFPSIRAQNLSRVAGVALVDDDKLVAADKLYKKLHDEAIRVLNNTGSDFTESKRKMELIVSVCVLDEDFHQTPFMVSLLNDGLSALHKHYMQS